MPLPLLSFEKVELSRDTKVPPALPWTVAVLIFAAVAAVFLGGHGGDFLRWDDDINIVNNPHLREPAPESLRWMFGDASYMRRYVPLAWLGWWIEHQLFGLTPRSAHVSNILFHAASSVLLFFILQHVLVAWRRSRPLAAGTRTTVAMLGALVWGVHPLRVEVVAWASGRMYCVAGFFLFLALLAYLRAAGCQSRGTHALWMGAATLSFGASLLTYPIGLTFVAVLIVLDVWMRRFQPGGIWAHPRNRAVWFEKIPFLAVAITVAAATLAARFDAQGLWQPPPTLAEFGAAARAAQASYIWIYYVLKPLLPVGLAPVYSTLVEFNPAGLKFVFSAIALVGVTVVLIRKRREWPGVLALWVTHLLLLAPMLGVMEHPHYANDRYSYLQGVLWSVVIVGAVVLACPVLAPRVTTLAAAAMVGGLAVASAAQIKLWQNDETFFRALYGRLNDPISRADIALRLGDALRTQGRWAEAAAYYRESLGLVPNGVRAAVPHFGLAIVARAERRFPAAIAHFQAAISRDPNFVQAYQGAGDLLITTGQAGQALSLLQRAVSLEPGNGEARELLGVALFQTGKYADAVTEFSAAVRLDPTFVRAHFNLGRALRDSGRRAEAATAFENAIRLKPDYTAAREELARLQAP